MHQPIRPRMRSLLRRPSHGLFDIRALFVLAAAGLIAGLVSAYISAQPVPAEPPAFNPPANPYAQGIYAEGIVESAQESGANISIFPEVPGPVTRVFVAEGAHVKKGQPLIAIDDSIQRQTTAQLEAQVKVAQAQIANARANLKTASDTLAKQQDSFTRDPQSVSLDTLDTDRNNAAVQRTNVELAQTNYAAAVKAAAASEALLAKYIIRAPADGAVMSIESNVGSYVSTQGAWDLFTQGYLPLIVMGREGGGLEVRAYIDEILIDRLPSLSHITGRMMIRGTDASVPLTFERVEPYVSPKIELSDQRLEQVDVRVLPVIFRFQTPSNVRLYPGELVDVYVGQK
jgi:HlyD family secretion protein